MMAILAVAAIAVTAVACKKEKKQAEFQELNEADGRKPIATYDNTTGQMTCHVSVEELQGAMDDYTASKSVGEVIVESWSISDNESSENPVLTLSVIEVDSESSSKTAMYNTFVEKVTAGNSTEYYLTDLVRSGNYNYITSDGKDSFLVTVENNEVVSVELYNAKAPWTGGITISCVTEFCKNEGGCSPPEDPSGDCSQCDFGTCEQTKTATYLSNALSAF